MTYRPETDSHIRDKVKVVLALSNYDTKIRTCYRHWYILFILINTSDLAVKKDFIALKVEVDKLEINKLTNVPTSLNNIKTKLMI